MLSLFVLLMACSEYTVNEATDTVEPPLTSTTATETKGHTSSTSHTTTTFTATTSTQVASAPVYANTFSTLYEIVPSTGERKEIGPFTDASTGAPVEYFVDIAIDLSGRMVGGTFDELYSINPTTAAVTYLCTADVDMYALAFTPNGYLIAGSDEGVYYLDTFNCDDTPMLSNSEYITSGDLVGLPDGYLYWTVELEKTDGLVRIDPSNGVTLFLGDTGFEDIYGLGYDNGNLYGFNALGETIRISPDTASSTLVTSSSKIQWWGATTNPVKW
jgi:hypothetical protein